MDASKVSMAGTVIMEKLREVTWKAYQRGEVKASLSANIRLVNVNLSALI